MHLGDYYTASFKVVQFECTWTLSLIFLTYRNFQMFLSELFKSFIRIGVAALVSFTIALYLLFCIFSFFSFFFLSFFSVFFPFFQFFFSCAMALSLLFCIFSFFSFFLSFSSSTLAQLPFLYFFLKSIFLKTQMGSNGEKLDVQSHLMAFPLQPVKFSGSLFPLFFSF
jgi:hypothetical protein